MAMGEATGIFLVLDLKILLMWGCHKESDCSIDDDSETLRQVENKPL